MSWLPSWVWTVSPLWWLGIALGFAILLILVGLWGRRVGRELRCRKCGYEIAELPSAKCPECGLADVTRRPKRGVYRARPMFVLVGGVLLIVCATPVGWMLSKANWRTLVPAPVLIAAVDFGDEAAAKELMSRSAVGGLDEQSVRRVVAGALLAQKEAPLGSARLKHWLQILGDLDAQVILTDDEWEQMMLHGVRDVKVSVRPRTREGDAVPLVLDIERTIPTRMAIRGTVHITPSDQVDPPSGNSARFRYDGDWQWPQDAKLSAAHSLRAGNASGTAFVVMNCEEGAVGWRLGIGAMWPSERAALARAVTSMPASGTPFVLGTATSQPIAVAPMPVATPAGFEFLRSTPFSLGDVMQNTPAGAASAPARRPLPRIQRTAPVSIQVFAAGSDEDCEPLSGPEVRRQVENLLQFGHARVQFGDRDHGVIYEWQEPTIRMVEPTTMPLAFEAFLVQGERRVRWGTIDAAAGDALLNRTLPADCFEQMKTPGELFLELVPTRDFARTSLDLRYVNERFRFGPLPYTPRPEVGSGARGG